MDEASALHSGAFLDIEVEKWGNLSALLATENTIPDRAMLGKSGKPDSLTLSGSSV